MIIKLQGCPGVGAAFFYLFFILLLFKSSSDNLKSQIATSSWGGNRKLPYAFTEQGVYMLATVLKGNIAVEQSKMLMRIFKQMKDYILSSVPNKGNAVIVMLLIGHLVLKNKE